MGGLFRRGEAARDPCPGRGALALPAARGQKVPPGCIGLVFDERGHLQRIPAGARLGVKDGQSASIFHPGPYELRIAPYAQAPEAGLRLVLVVDSPDPRLAVQRFDLFLAAEAAGEATVASLRDLLEAAVRRELARGALFLPPCTSIDEWNAFRRGINELVYTRFGMAVEDCLPVDLGDTVDFAAGLAARVPAAAVAAAPAAPPAPGAPEDARALRRLFLELPGVSGALRLALPGAGAPFAQQRALLARLDRACVAVETMPALALRAPGVAAPRDEQARRAAAGVSAALALDEAWALLARLRAGATGIDEAERIVADLERALHGRRATSAEGEMP